MTTQSTQESFQSKLLNRKTFDEIAALFGFTGSAVDFFVVYNTKGQPFFIFLETDQPEPALAKIQMHYVSRVTVGECGDGCPNNKKQVCKEGSEGQPHCKCKRCR